MSPQPNKPADDVNLSSTVRSASEQPLVSDGRSSVFDSYFGPRAASAQEFASALELRSMLSESELERIFRASGGHTRIAASLVRARVEAGLPAGDTDPDRTVAMLSPELTPTVGAGSRESAALYLLALFAWAPQITPSMVDLVHAAFAAAEVATSARPEELTSLLTAEGLITASADTDAVFTVPDLIRALMRRVTSVDTNLAEKSPREALGAAVSDSIGRQRSDRREGLTEVVELVLELRDWHVLVRAWARRSVNVFIDVPSAIEAYLSVPEEVVAQNPILTLARSAARRIDSTRTRLGTDDMPTLLSATDFSSIVLPEMHGLLSAESERRLTADEVAVVTMLEARTHRLNRENEAALNVIEVGRERLRHLSPGEPGPTLMLQAELNLEHGRNLVVAGRFPEAMCVLQRVVQFAEIYAPNSPHPLLAGLVETALAGMGHGHGSDMDRNLARAREDARRFGMAALPDEFTALCIELTRSLDRLDLDTAGQILIAIDQAKPTQFLGPIPHVLRSLCFVYEGRASAAAKLLVESPQVQLMPTTGVPSARFSAIVNIVGFVLAAAGEGKALQDLAERMSPQSPGYSVVKARQAFVFGQHDSLWTATGQSLAGDEGPRLKSCAMALRADMLHHEGRSAEALEAFVDMLDYCAITASVLAVTQLSKSAREALIPASADCSEWVAVARSFNSAELTAAVLQKRLLELPETSPVSPDFQTDLTPAEQSLLFAIDSSKSIAQIAREFGVVSGTLKNRLSALYRKLGVRSRAEAVAHANRAQQR
ncbi:LuxR family transcriptional regulator [Brevibacterium permense]|uniref:helix-turn-helix transcriptional regulator n=1 Tax=Brevibacterium permense TaxID=234834 RepID=UPI0021D16403|nr:LuxR family transcriptional regulator [Brevibacterium permense]